MTSHTGSARRIWGFWKSQLVELRPAAGEDRWLSLSRVGLVQVSYEIGGRWKRQNRKNVYLSPYVEEPLNSKLIKSFVRSRKSFSCFDILMFHVIYICIFHIDMLCPFHMWLLLWLWYIVKLLDNAGSKNSQKSNDYVNYSKDKLR